MYYFTSKITIQLFPNQSISQTFRQRIIIYPTNQKIRRQNYAFKTNKEILTQFPSWTNHPSGNIRQVRYGDIPDCQYTQESYNHYQQETDPHLLNILCANAYIYSQHGAYDNYKTIAGDIYIHTETQQVLYGSINIPYRGKPITCHMNLMYGLKALSLLSLRGTW